MAAIDDRLTLYNPTAKIKFRADSHSKKAKALSRIEQIRLTKHLQNNDNDLGELFLFDLATGLLLGEALALRWNDISFEEGIVKVRRSLERIRAKGGYRCSQET